MQRLLKVCLIIFVLLPVGLLQAQLKSQLLQKTSVVDSSDNYLSDRYEKQTIRLSFSPWTGKKFIINGNSYSPGFLNRNLKDVLMNVPEAGELASIGTRNYQYGMITSLIGIPWIWSSLLNDVKEPEDFYQNLPRALMVSCAFRLVSDYFFTKGKDYFSQAIWTYNKEAILGKTPSQKQNIKEHSILERIPSGRSYSIAISDLYVLGYHGKLLNLKRSEWEKSWLSKGYEIGGSIFQDSSSTRGIFRMHRTWGFHLRRLGKVYPYGILAAGFNIEPSDNSFEDKNAHVAFGLSSNIKVGLAAEIGAIRLAVETGGGSMGTGHVEPTTVEFSYITKPLPAAKLFKNYNVTAGVQSFYAFSGKYKGEEGGFDFNLTRGLNGKRVNYNVGFFLTNYLMGTGVFHGGKEWQMNTMFSKYLDIMAGGQILLWCEPEPDLILPAASASIRLKITIWKFLIFGQSRIIGTYSPKAGLVTGSLISFGIGLAN